MKIQETETDWFRFKKRGGNLLIEYGRVPEIIGRMRESQLGGCIVRTNTSK